MVSRGFSLIELIITLLVMALLLLAAAPFSGTWLDGQHQSQLRNALLEGIGQARSLALRNPRCLLADNAGTFPEAVRLYYRNNQLQLIQPESTAGCTATPTWPTDLDDVTPWWRSATVGGSPQLVYGDETGTAVACLGFDSRALPVTTGDCAALASRVAIKVGSREPLYVDLR